MQKCPYCGSEDLILNPARGDTVCGNPMCGELLEESTMVTEQQFMQTSSGGAVATGHRVNFNNFGAYAGGAVHHGTSELALSRGITKIGWIADRLHLSAPTQEAARRMFQLAVQMNFNIGRTTRFVACACLYIVCRRSKSPHLLIDFADVLQTPVKTLGRVYTGFLKRLVGGDPSHQAALCDMVEVPMIDPSVFIERFARKLDLGNMQRKVQGTAMRIIQFMHRDWICVGRRPNGLCGAAILVASFYHGFQVSAKTIADIVRMQECTLKVRLCEMRQTPMALLSREQFEQTDPETQAIEDHQRALPPCMLRRRMQERRAALLDKEREQASLLDSQAAPALKDGLADASADDEEKKSKIKTRPPVPPMLPLPQSSKGDDSQLAAIPVTSAGSGGPDANASASSSVSSGAVEGASASSASSGKSSQAGQSSEDADARAQKYTATEPSGEGIEEIAKDIMHALLPADKAGPIDKLDLGALSDTVDPIEALIKGKPSFETEVDAASDPGTPKSANTASSVAVGSAEPDTLDDVEDLDLDVYLLDAEEKQCKSDIWHEVNKDYLEEWYVRAQEKRRKAERMAQSNAASETGSQHSGATSGSGSRKSRRHMYPPASSCTQSAMMALSKKGKVGTNRINIEALESLFS